MRIEIVIAGDVRWDLRETLLRAGFEVAAHGTGFRVRVGAVTLGRAQASVHLVAGPAIAAGSAAPVETPCDRQGPKPQSGAARDVAADTVPTPKQAASSSP